MIKYLKLVHNWIGFVISIVMLIVLVTGVYLGGVDLLGRLDDKQQQYRPLTPAAKAQIVDEVFKRYPQASSVKLPTPQSPYIEAGSRKQSVYLTPELAEIGTQARGDNQLWRWLFFFHRNFQLDNPGKQVNAVSSTLAAVIMLVGFYLWWLVRKGFKWKHTLPKNSRTPALFKSHLQLGVICAVPMFIMAVTGAYITWGKWPDNEVKVAADAPVLGAPQDWQSQVLAAQKLWPDAELISVSKPRRPGDNDFIYRMSFNGDNPFALTQTDTIRVDLNSGQLQSAQTFADKGLMYQAKYSARFLHDGGRMPTWYLLVLVVSSILGTLLVAFGMTTFIRKELAPRFKRA